MKSKIVIVFTMVFGFVLLSALPATATGTTPPHEDNGCVVKATIIGADCDCITLEVSGCDVDLLTIEYQLTITAVRCDSADPAGGMFIRGSATISGLHDIIKICYIQACVDGACSIEEYLQSGGPFLPSVTATISHGTTHHTVVAENDGITIPDCGPDIPPASCDDGDKPKVQMLTMQYLGDVCLPGCEDDGNDQDVSNTDPNKRKVECVNNTFDDHDDVYIISANKKSSSDKNYTEWGRDPVSIDGFFDIDASVGGKTKLDADTYLFIFTADPNDGGVLLRTLKFHTSCSQPLRVEDVFCIVRVDRIVLE